MIKPPRLDIQNILTIHINHTVISGKGFLVLTKVLKNLVNIIHGLTRNILVLVKVVYKPFPVIF